MSLRARARIHDSFTLNKTKNDCGSHRLDHYKLILNKTKNECGSHRLDHYKLVEKAALLEMLSKVESANK